MTSLGRFLDWLLGPIFDHAGDCWAGYSTGPRAAHLPCSGFYGEHGATVALGGCATEIPTCHAPRSDWVAGDDESNHVGWGNTL